MLIRVFPPHYQLVYINFDISSFSLISYIAKDDLFLLNTSPFTIKKMMYRGVVKYFLGTNKILLILETRFLVIAP